MAAPTDETMLETWKRQLDAALRLTEVVIEGSQRMREMQMQAAATAHADAVATQKALARASSRDELMRIQGRQAAAGGRRGGRRRGAFGYNAASGEYGDLVQMGVLDPCKVTRAALQNASSIAGLILTTDCMIARAPEGPAPGGGAAEMPQ